MSWTQWTGQRRVVYDSAALLGLAMVWKSTKGRLPAWLGAKEMWSGGCQSWVATLRVKAGRARRLLMSGVMDRPSATARAPFCGGVSNRRRRLSQRKFLRCHWMVKLNANVILDVTTEVGLKGGRLRGQHRVGAVPFLE